MKKFAVKVVTSFCLLFFFIFAVSITFYFLIANKIASDKIRENLDFSSESINWSIQNKLNGDINSFKELIDTYTLETDSLDEKIDKLNNEKSKINFFKNLDGGFGKLIDEDNKVYYNINGTNYINRNSNFYSDSARVEINFCNFGKDYVVNENKTNEFTDKLFIVLNLDNIIIYFDAYSYLTPIYSLASSIELIDYYIFSKDGYLYFEKDEVKDSSFYAILRSENMDTDIDYFKKNLEKIKFGDNYSTKFKFNGKSSFVMISKITNWENNYDLYLANVYSIVSAASLASTLLIPFAVILFIFLVSIIVFSIIIYKTLSRREKGLNSNAFVKKDKIYHIVVNSNGEIKDYSKNFKELLNDNKKYLKITDFEWKSKNEQKDIETTLNLQQPIIVHLTNEETSNNEEICIRFMVIKSKSNYLLLGENDTETIKKEERNNKLALANPATLYPNLIVLREDLEELITKVKQEKEKSKNVVIAIEIEKLHHLINLIGSKVANKTLVKVAEILNNLCEGYDYKFYHTLKYYAIIFKNLNAYDDAITWVNNTIQEFKRPLKVEANDLIINLRFGIFNLDVVSYPNITPVNVTDSLEKLLNKINSLSTKHYEVFDLSLVRYISEEEMFEKDLQHAISNDEFYMELQPQYNTETKKVIGFEALIRWNNPKYKDKSPQRFIHVAEENGMIIQIGQFVLNESFRIAHLLDKYNVTISINVSPVQLLQAGFISELFSLAEINQVDCHKIAIEITETFLMENFDVAIEKLKILRKKGFTVHLDDFGTGYSSLLYLKELPIDAIKIDKEFIGQVVTDKATKQIVSKIIAIANALDLEVIAEGVENTNQNDFLEKNGCNIIQGYLISKAMKYEDAIVFLNETDKINLSNKKETKKTRNK